MPEAPRASLREVLASSVRLGLTSFGGPIAHLGYFRHEYVDRRRWIDDERFGELVALCQSLPGPASSQLGIAIGTLRAGRWGGLVAWLGFTLPSAVLLTAFALSTAMVDVSGAGWLRGLKLAAVVIVADAVLTMARSLTPDLARRLIAAAAAAIALLVPAALTQVGLIAAGALAGLVALRVEPVGGSDGTATFGAGGRRAAGVALATFVVLLVALPLVAAVAPGTTAAVIDAFYRAGALVFGGGHVVLPLLHESVVAPGWVTDDRFLAGYGAVQAVPGPLFTFASFLGASMAVGPGGILGAVVATVAIFAPSFLLVWGVLPLWSDLRRSDVVRRGLAGANAAVVGILAAALVSPIGTSAIAGVPDVVLAAAGFGLLRLAGAPPWVVVAALAVGGEVAGRLF